MTMASPFGNHNENTYACTFFFVQESRGKPDLGESNLEWLPLFILYSMMSSFCDLDAQLIVYLILEINNQGSLNGSIARNL